jgi:selenium metabolism protein YedF
LRRKRRIMTLLYVASETIGHGSDELGRILMPAYMNAFAKGLALPNTIAFVNSGVKLLTANSPAFEALRELESRGVKIIACGTCLDYFDLKDKLAVGSPTNAAELTALMLAADTVVKL